MHIKRLKTDTYQLFIFSNPNVEISIHTHKSFYLT